MDSGANSYRRFCENGDENGLIEIIQCYKDGLIFFLTGIVGNIHTAEDLAEDTFVLLGTKKPKDKGSGSFKTWLYTIGRNIAIDYLRKYSNHKEIPVINEIELMNEEIDFELLYQFEERKILLHKALRKLKPEYQQVLWLFYFEELSNKEIAQIMKKNVHAIETLAYRARNSLKNQLEKEGFSNEI